MLPAALCRIVTHAATPKQRAFSAFIMLHPLTDSPTYHSQYLRQLQTPKLTPYQVADICMPHHEPKNSTNTLLHLLFRCCFARSVEFSTHDATICLQEQQRNRR